MQKDGILQGIRVLDFTRIVAGPYATRILADFGAEVIKVQTAQMAKGIESDTTPYFCAWNRNKRSITLNMDHRQAREIFLKLVRISDVVVENFSPRVMSNWELNYDNLKKSNEKLIMLSMSGMGQTGPWKDYVAFGPTVQPLGGLTHLTAYSQDAPMGLGYAYADMISGLYGAISILAALEYRDRNGQGKYIDLSEYETVCTAVGPALMDAFVNMTDMMPIENNDAHLPAAPYGCYQCQGEDRWCAVAVFSEKQWQALCSVFGNPAWSHEDRFASLSERQKHKRELDLLISKQMRKQKAESAAERLQQAGVPAGVVQNAHELANDPQLIANGFFTSLNHPVLGETKTETTPINFKNHRETSWRPSPLLGEANKYVFGELLGMTKAAIRSYVEEGIIA